MLKHQNFILVVSGPSGSGKTTICRKLLSLDENIVYSISATTRPRREGETHGVDYYFLDKSSFLQMIENNELLEWAKVYEHYYGTPKKPVLNAIENGKDVIMDIDVQGKRQVERNFHGRVVSVFILPPSLDDLVNRLKRRGAGSEDELKRRLKSIKNELEWRWEYDYWVVNEDLDNAVNDVFSIIKSERLKGKFLKWDES